MPYVRFTKALALAAAFALAPRLARAQETVIDLSGEVELDDVDHVRIPFEVPAGTAEIEIAHDVLSDDNILDWGLDAPEGFRGWGGGNTEDAIVGVAAASRSYLTGPITPGTWYLVIGKAKLAAPPFTYAARATLRPVATLTPQLERRSYEPAPALEEDARWYAGDLHVHSRESGDARPPLDEIATFARSRGLDFVELSDHNTTSQLDFIVDAQARHPEILLMPGVEYTTYDGHANGIGATVFVDHKIGLDGMTIERAVEGFAAQGALLSVNHPTLDLGSLCIGCAWGHDVPASDLAAVEIATGGAYPLFLDSAIAFWEGLLDQGVHLAAVGGSDDHKAGQDLDAFQDPIGEPTTMVRADRLDAASILDAIRAGRTVVRVTPDEPMVELGSDPPPVRDTVDAARAIFSATIRGPFVEGTMARFVVDGVAGEAVDVDADPLTLELEVPAPSTGESRVRVEVLVGSARRVITSHLWLRAGTAQPGATTGGDDLPLDEGLDDRGGCDCRAATGGRPSAPAALATLLALGLVVTRTWRRARP